MKNNTFIRLFKLVLENKILFFLSLISAFIYVCCYLYIPIVQGQAIGQIVKINNVNFTKVNELLILIFVLVIISGFFQYLMTYLTSLLAFNVVSSLRKKAFAKLLKVPLKYLDLKGEGDILVRMSSDIDVVSEGLMQALQKFLVGILMIVGTIGFMFYLCYPLAILTLLLSPLSLFVASFIAKGSAKTFKKQAEVKRELGALNQEALNNFLVIKSNGYEGRELEKFKKTNDDLAKVGFKSQFYGALANPSTRFVNAIIYALLATLGAILSVLNGMLDVAKLYSFLSYANQYTKPFNEISQVLAELQNSFASATSIFALMDEEDEVDEGCKEIKEVKGAFELEHVSFSYDQKVKILDDLSLKVNPGETIAIVGPTGCGKTTLINLIMRFYELDAGLIKLDGENIENISKENLHKYIGMVLQDCFLFEGTIYENVAYGKQNASKEEIIEACKKSNAHDFIIQMKNGYDTIIRNDDSLSQGQKQLLCIARLFLELPPVLILDEATSNIDTRMEIKVQESFKKLMEGRTSFIIAHRLQTIKNSDLILVLNNGKIMEVGKHQDLLNNNGFYKELYYSQFKGDN